MTTGTTTGTVGPNWSNRDILRTTSNAIDGPIPFVDHVYQYIHGDPFPRKCGLYFSYNGTNFSFAYRDGNDLAPHTIEHLYSNSEVGGTLVLH